MGLRHNYSALQRQHESRQIICEPNGHCCVSVTFYLQKQVMLQGSENSQIRRVRNYVGGCQGLGWGSVGDEELVFNGDRVSV